ncbi:hypothetical protein D3C78_1567170 [compost metagenome]
MQTSCLGSQRLFDIVRLPESSFEQAVAERVTLQCVQHEGFFIGQGGFGRFEIHLEALREKMPDRVAQKVLQQR